MKSLFLSPKEFKLSEVLASACNYAYKQIDDNTSCQIEKETGIYEVEPFCFNSDIPLWRILGFSGYYDNHLVIAIKGTDSIPDWLKNTKFLHDNPLSWKKQSDYNNGRVHGKVHYGFNQAVNYNLVGLKSLLKKRRREQNQEILLTGHSLGGAIAILTAIGLSNSNEFPCKKTVYTYGAPRVGNIEFRVGFDELKELTHNRFEHCNDIVPQLPLARPFRFITHILKAGLLYKGIYIPLEFVPEYQHTGDLKYLTKDEQGNLIVIKNPSELERFLRRLKGYANNASGLVNYLQNEHHIENYTKHIKNLNQERLKQVKEHRNSEANMLNIGYVLAFIETLKLVGQTKSWLENIKIFPLLTYRNVIDYFLEERPKYPEYSIGVILRLNDSGIIKIYQVFIDSNDKFICYPGGVPYGRVLLAQKLDQELEEAFGNMNMVLFQ